MRLLFLIAYAWPILDPELPSSVRRSLGLVAWAAWALFVVDYLVRLALATERGKFFLRNIFDLRWSHCLSCARCAYFDS
jgi:voltage-gated potassium channel